MGFVKTNGDGETLELSGKTASTDSKQYFPLGRDNLHGRAQIFTNEQSVTAANVLDVLNAALPTHLKNRSEEVYLEKYLRGVQPVLDRVKKYNDYVMNKVVVNIANQVVSFKTAEFAGEPITYVSRSSKKSVPKKVEKLNSMMLSEGKQSKDMDLAYKMFTCGVGYRLVLNDKAARAAKEEQFDEAPFEIFIPDPRNTFVIRLNDVSRQIVAGVTYVFLDESQNKVQYTVYTPDETFTIEGTAMRGEKVTKTVTHNFGMVTMIEYPCNPIYMGAFESVLPLLDAINNVQSNRIDGIEQFVQAIMVFEGVDISREQLTELKDLGAIKLPPSIDGRQSRVYYLNEQLDQQQTQTLVDDMYQTILQIVGLPSQGNGRTGDSSNNGAVLLKNGWWSAEARTLEAEGMWKDAETQFLKIALKICKDAGVIEGLSVSDVEPKFSRRSYEDLLVKSQSFASLRAANVSPLQAFKYSHISQDPESDALEFVAYQEELAEKEAAQLDAATGVGGVPNTGSAKVAYGEGDETDTSRAQDLDNEGTGHPKGSYAVCPICGRQFRKRVNNQRYDRDVCRRAAKRKGEA